MEDFGPITQAKVELRPLTVFFGPSNAGKSYLAKLIYALHGYFSRHLAFTRNAWRITDFAERARETQNLIEKVHRLEDYIRRPGTGSAKSTDDEKVKLEADLGPLARAAVKMLDVAPVLADEVLRVYDADTPSALIRKSASAARFTLSHGVAGQERKLPFHYAFKMRRDGLSLKLGISEDAPIRFQRSGSYWMRARDPDFFYPPSRAAREEPLSLMRLQAVLADLAQPCTVGAISRFAYYLPANRAGLVEIQGPLLASLLEGLARGSRRGRPSTWSGVLVDFMQTFVDVGSRFSEWKPGELLAKRVERRIIDGTTRLRKLENGALSIAYRPTGWKEDLPVTRTSSMVTEIVPLVLYLRHYVTPGSTIIIEEPEAHMHPAMQVRMATAIADIVNAGVRVIVTTHSEWILSALANLVRSAGLSTSERTGVAGHGIALHASEVGCWRFAPGADGGSVTSEFSLDSDNGMYDAGYPEVGQELYNTWAAIISRLQED